MLLAALKLLEAPAGPVLEDFPEDAPVSKDQTAVLSCPVDFTQEEVSLTETEQLCAALKREMAAIRPWYEMAVKKRGRTTVGVSGLHIDIVPDFICSFLKGDLPEPPRDDISLPYVLNLATDDLKAYYSEGITSQPGQEFPSSKAVSEWFWGKTVAGDVLLSIKDVCAKSEDGLMQKVGNVLIVPMQFKNGPKIKKSST
ncbi:MAG: hypothetical protein MUO68_07000 [Desulfobacteraceae bacterium]|nr:hypothetical protein [Desulfobacteraceae bacterium]